MTIVADMEYLEQNKFELWKESLEGILSEQE